MHALAMTKQRGALKVAILAKMTNNRQIVTKDGEGALWKWLFWISPALWRFFTIFAVAFISGHKWESFRVCFLVQMRAFVFWTSLRIANVHLKAKPTWILEVVVVVVVVNKMTPSYKCSFAGRPFIQLRQTREILQKLSKVTFPVHCLIYYQHNVNLQNVLKMS